MENKSQMVADSFSYFYESRVAGWRTIYKQIIDQVNNIAYIHHIIFIKISASSEGLALRWRAIYEQVID